MRGLVSGKLDAAGVLALVQDAMLQDFNELIDDELRNEGASDWSNQLESQRADAMAAKTYADLIAVLRDSALVDDELGEADVLDFVLHAIADV